MSVGYQILHKRLPFTDLEQKAAEVGLVEHEGTSIDYMDSMCLASPGHNFAWCFPDTTNGTTYFMLYTGKNYGIVPYLERLAESIGGRLVSEHDKDFPSPANDCDFQLTD